MRKTKEIKVRMTENEWNRLNALSVASGKSREEFVRLALRGTTIRASPPAEYGEILRELRRIGSNIHQIILKARTLGFIDEPMLQESVNTIRNMDRLFMDSFI